MDLRQAAQTAMDIQDACNLSGVAHALSQTMETLWAEARATGQGTDFVNQHPIVTLYLSKLASLNRTQNDDTAFHRAWNAVEKIAAL